MITGLAERIKELRVNKQISQAKLATYLGLTKGAVNSWEVESTQPSLLCLIRLAKFFNVSTDYLLGLSDQRSINAEGLTNREVELFSQLIVEIKENRDIKK